MNAQADMTIDAIEEHAAHTRGPFSKIRLGLAQSGLYLAALLLVGSIVWAGAESSWLSGNSWLIYGLLAGSLISGIHVTWQVAKASYRDQRRSDDWPCAPGAELPPARPRANLVPQQWQDAHTFIYFDLASEVSLTLNVRDVAWLGPSELKVTFLQPIEEDSIVVRPFGGTPQLQVLACDGRLLHLRFAIAPVTVKLRILGTLVPLIKNHYPHDRIARLTASA